MFLRIYVLLADGFEYIEALECENVTIFPGELYLVGFLRNYSEYLGLDAKYMISFLIW